MNRRLFLPVIVLILSVLLLAGLMNYQVGQEQESSEDVGPTVENPVTVSQGNNDPVAEKKTVVQEESTNEAPTPAPTFMGMGGGGISAPKASSIEEKIVTSAIAVEADSMVVVADFDFSKDGLNVTFIDQSQNASFWYWDFGDGTNLTTTDNSSFVHEYTIPPTTYTVTLVAYESDDEECKLNNDSIKKDLVLTSDSDNKDADDNSVKTAVPVQEVPEFPTIAIPMVAIIGMAFIFSRRQ